MNYVVELRRPDHSLAQVPASFDKHAAFPALNVIDARMQISGVLQPYFYILDDYSGLPALSSLLAKHTTERLSKAVHKLGFQGTADYFTDSKQNAGTYLLIMMLWSQIHPDCRWSILEHV